MYLMHRATAFFALCQEEKYFRRSSKDAYVHSASTAAAVARHDDFFTFTYYLGHHLR